MTFPLPLPRFRASRLSVLLLVLAGCQYTPPQIHWPSAGLNSEPEPEWHFPEGLFRRGTAVEDDLDEAQAASEGVRAVLLALPQKERERLLTRWLPVDGLVALAPSSVGVEQPVLTLVPPSAPVPESVDVLLTLRGLLLSQGTKELALAAFFAGPEPVARARKRLKLPAERIGLERLAGRLTRRELRYAQEARKWAGLYGLAWPVDRDWRLSSRFGSRMHPLLGTTREHRGVDISMPVGTPVRAPAAGVVVGAREGNANGKWLELRHDNGLRTVFCHLSSMAVKAGQKVAVGEEIALSGETGRVTGPHLHYQVSQAGAWLDPVGIRASRALVVSPVPWKSELLAAPTQAAMH